MFAIRDHCAGDTKKFVSIMRRYFALQRLWCTEEMDVLVKDAPEGEVQVSDAVFEAAAVLHIDPESGHFDQREFVERVKQIVFSKE
jgi:hypothetical protein